jgi:iron complex transport system substrate-binding protein
VKAIVVIVVGLWLAGPVAAREIVDMAGRTVDVPDHIERAVGGVAPVSWMIYAVAPTKLAAFTSAPSAADWHILDPRLKDRPVIGSFLGSGGVNQETLLAIKPDVVIFWGWGASAASQRWVEQLDRWNIPVVFVRMERLDDYPRTLEFLGNLLDVPERGQRLAQYGRDVMTHVAERVSGLSDTDRRRVYYAQGSDGLETEPEQSFHAELIGLAGGINVHKGTLKQRRGRERISLEQVIAYNPAVILAGRRDFYAHGVQQAGWERIDAVRKHQVWLIPDTPLNWFDRPPSMMRFLGLQWLARRLYPQRFDEDLVSVTQHFYRLFFSVELDRTSAQAIIGGSTEL